MAVVKIEIKGRGPLAGGATFGDVGDYEMISGILRFAVDPEHPRNAGITDLELAPRDTEGRVHFDADLLVMQPTDKSKGNGRILLDVPNRGRKLVLRMFNGASETETETGPDVGNGFLMRQGYTLAWCGWQYDIPPGPGQLGLRAPEAPQNGVRLRGKVSVELQSNQTVHSLMLSDRGHRPLSAADLEEPGATLTVRDTLFGERRLIARDRWRFAREENGSAAPDPNYVYLSDGFEAGKIYVAIYTTEGAPVAGVGLLAVRDAIAFLGPVPLRLGIPVTEILSMRTLLAPLRAGHFCANFYTSDSTKMKKSVGCLTG